VLHCIVEHRNGVASYITHCTVALKSNTFEDCDFTGASG
jgi:hypothetical protein